MAAIATMDVIARKWASVTPMRTADYEAGVRNPRRDWSQATAAAEDAWKGGVQAAAAKNLFSAGVRHAGTAKWQQGAIAKGVARWGPGVSVAEPDYSAGFSPYREAISRTTLPQRYPARDPRNLARVKAIVDAMIAVKEGRTLQPAGPRPPLG